MEAILKCSNPHTHLKNRNILPNLQCICCSYGHLLQNKTKSPALSGNSALTLFFMTSCEYVWDAQGHDTAEPVFIVFLESCRAQATSDRDKSYFKLLLAHKKSEILSNISTYRHLLLSRSGWPCLCSHECATTDILAEHSVLMAPFHASLDSCILRTFGRNVLHGFLDCSQ